MIELLRYAKDHAEGLASAEVLTNSLKVELTSPGVMIRFKRHDVRTGREIEPEESFVTFSSMAERLEDLKKEQAVLEELLALRPE